MDDAKFKPPDVGKVWEYQDAVSCQHPSLEVVWYTIDDIKLVLECLSDDDDQKRFYNGWTCNHYIGVALVFWPGGNIPICCYNVSRNVHDSLIASIAKFDDKLEEVYNTI